MADIDPGDDARLPFRELHGDYVENTGQVINLRQYLDYFEPLGSALSRLPDGTGGPFVHHFTDSGGRAIGSIGWVVSAASKRFGGWKLWGMWSSRQIPAVALPLYWPALSDPARVPDWVGRANDASDLLLNRDRWPDLLDEVNTTRLHDAAFRELLKTELARTYAAPPPYRHPLEVELTAQTLDVLPWLYLLGPVDPDVAQLQPSRFHGAGYQYILAEQGARRVVDAEVPYDVDAMVDRTADDVLAGWQMANELRARRVRPRAAESRRPPRRRVEGSEVEERSRETSEMHSGRSTQTSAPQRKTRPKDTPTWQSAGKEAAAIFGAMGEPLYRLAVIGLLAWIALNVNTIRKATVAQPDAATVRADTPEPVPERRAAAVPEPVISTDRVRRIATSLSARPIPGIPISDAALAEMARGSAGAVDKMAHVAVEVFLRRNGCFDRSVLADGRFSAAEQRAIQGCAVLQDERLMTGIGPDTARAIAWLERTIPQ